MSSPEQLPQTAERGIESAGAAAAERSAELRNSPESSNDTPERAGERADAARKDAAETAISREAPSNELSSKQTSTHHVKPVNSRKTREKAYKDILKHTQSELPAASRAFSKVVHQPVVEKTSAAVGGTVARPNAILFGALFAFVISAAVYAIAKYYGYSLSGFEAIAAFIIGWIVGMVVDFLRLAFRRR